MSASSIKLVCLDFDGTFMVYDEPPGFMHPEVLTRVNHLKERGIDWCANSGRDMGSQLEVLALSRTKGLHHMPMALLTRETLIYEWDEHGYMPHEPWNANARKLLRDFHESLQGHLKNELAGLVDRYHPLQMFLNEEATAFLISDESSSPSDFYDELEVLVDRVPGGAVSRNGGWVAALPAGLGKGKLLHEITVGQGLTPEAILAIGDHHNDASMLNTQVAAYTGCPGDAYDQAKAAVQKAGGYIAKADGPLGTAEVLDHFLSHD